MRLPEGTYKLAVVEVEGDLPRRLAVWETVEIGEEDLLLDCTADLERYSAITP